MGYINLHGKVCTTFSAIMDLSLIPGKVGLVSQSGAMGQALFQRIAAEANKSRKPIVALSAVGTLSDDCLPILRETGRVMIFRSFSQCARSLRAVLDYLERRRIAGQGKNRLGKEE